MNLQPYCIILHETQPKFVVIVFSENGSILCSKFSSKRHDYHHAYNNIQITRFKFIYSVICSYKLEQLKFVIMRNPATLGVNCGTRIAITTCKPSIKHWSNVIRRMIYTSSDIWKIMFRHRNTAKYSYKCHRWLIPPRWLQWGHPDRKTSVHFIGGI